MRVKRLKMTAFRGISDLTLEFDEIEPTVFIGVNGAGKSSILDCIAILLSHLISRIQYIPNLIGEQPDGGNTIQSYFTRQDIRNGHQQTHNEITISWRSRQATLSLVTVGNHRIVPSGTEFQGIVENIRRELEANPEANLPLVVYYPVNRAVVDIPLNIQNGHLHLFKQVGAYDQALMNGKIDFNPFFNWFRNQEDLENELRLDDNPDYRNRQLEAVRHAISSLLDSFSNLRVRRSPLRMTITKQGQELIVNQLSDGEKGLLALAGDLARRLAIANPSLPDPLQGSGVVLIDEIELHLHPKWQREIIPALTRTFPNCQFIVTTHSPQVLSQVKPEGIYILERTDAGIVAMRPESSYGRDTNRILEDLMDTPERPQEIKESLLELFRLIAKGELDSARQLHQKIADEIGADEPELVGASVSIRRREILGR